jgi:hypothetical protein
MERGPSWEASSYWASQDIPRILRKSEDPLPCLQEQATGPSPEPDESSTPIPFIRAILIILSYLRLGLPSGPFLHVS